MKTTTKKNIDAMAKIKKQAVFKSKAKEIDARLRLAVEVYSQREKMNLSQQALAKKINSTQKVISKLENGDMNVGFDLVNRLAKALNFTVENWARIYNFSLPVKLLSLTKQEVSH